MTLLLESDLYGVKMYVYMYTKNDVLVQAHKISNVVLDIKINIE